MRSHLITAADIAEANGEHDKAARYRAQDRERGLARWNIIGNGRNSDGSPSQEALDFVALCVAQCKANLQGGTTPALQRPAYHDGTALAEVQRLLGVRATPQEHNSDYDRGD